MIAVLRTQAPVGLVHFSMLGQELFTQDPHKFSRISLVKWCLDFQKNRARYGYFSAYAEHDDDHFRALGAATLLADSAQRRYSDDSTAVVGSLAVCANSSKGLPEVSP